MLFEDTRHDTMIELLWAHVGLVGRREELKCLQAAQAPSLICVSGHSGVGKTYLMNAFAESLAGNRVWGRAKYEPDAVVSFSVIGECLRAVLDQLFREDKCWKEILSTELAGALRTLSAVVPGLAYLIGDRTLTDTFAATGAAVTRLRLAVRAVLRRIAKAKSVTLLLDDVQWADSESIQLISYLLNDPSGNILVVASCRPESTAVDQLAAEVNAERQTRIHLENLTPDAIRELLETVLRRKGESDVVPLAQLIYQKTSGNPFFTVELVRLLQVRGLLWYSFVDYRWMWDLARIHTETDVSDNVADLLQQKLHKMPVELQRALSMAAFLGPTRFDVGLLSQMPLESAKEQAKEAHLGQLEKLLNLAVREGLLEDLSHGRFKFAHDRIQECALLLLPAGDFQGRLHCQIGCCLQPLIDTSLESDPLVLLAAFHFKEGSRFIETQPERRRAATVLLEAAQIVIKASSHVVGAEYLEAGLDLLGANRWKMDYGLTLGLAQEFAHVLFCLGRLDQSRDTIGEIMTEAHSLEDKVPAYKTLALNLGQSTHRKEAVEVLLDVLGQLGVHFPRHFVKFHLIRKLFKTKRALSRLADDTLLHLPVARSSSTAEAIHDFLPMLIEMCHVADLRELRVLCSLQMIDMAMHGGYSSISAVSMAAAGAMFAMLGDLASAHRFATNALQLTTQSQFPINDARAILSAYTFSLHWKTSYSECLEPILQAHELFQSIGATHQLFFSGLIYLFIYFCSGLDLQPVEPDARRCVEMLVEYRHMYHLSSLLPLAQLIHNLMGKTDNPLVLDGEFMQQDVLLAQCSKLDHRRGIHLLMLCRLFLAVYFNDYQLADELSSGLLDASKIGPVPWISVRFFFQGLAAFAMAKSGTRRIKHYTRTGYTFLAKLESFVAKGAGNCHHMLLLLRAEFRSLHASPKTAYDQAITAAGRLGYVHHQALANECAGRYFLANSSLSLAEDYLVRARDLYHQWGAVAKVAQLTQRYRFLAASESLSRRASGRCRARSRLRGSLLQHQQHQQFLEEFHESS